jgi:hypothetical protein
MAQNLSDPLGRKFAGSTRTRSVIGQAFFPSEKQHGYLVIPFEGEYAFLVEG